MSDTRLQKLLRLLESKSVARRLLPCLLSQVMHHCRMQATTAATAKQLGGRYARSPRLMSSSWFSSSARCDAAAGLPPPAAPTTQQGIHHTWLLAGSILPLQQELGCACGSCRDAGAAGRGLPSPQCSRPAAGCWPARGPCSSRCPCAAGPPRSAASPPEGHTLGGLRRSGV